MILFPLLHVGCLLGISSLNYSGGFGFASVRARCGDGAAAWITGSLDARGAQAAGTIVL